MENETKATIIYKLTTFISIAFLMAMSLARVSESNTAATLQPIASAKQQTPQRLLLEGFVPADGSKTDAATGLPTRIVHKASGIVLVLIPAGEFLMGSPDTEPERSSKEQQHRRVIRKPFYLGETEVTIGQFRKFVEASKYLTDAERGAEEAGLGKGAFASIPQGNREWSAEASWRNPFPNLKDYCLQDDHPVVQVSWNDAQRFAAHFGFQLPTEAQWEYACRAGSRTSYFWGDSEAGGKGYANVADEAAKRRFPSTNVLFPFDDGAALVSAVGRYKPNAWMLYDMIGNVEEWCEDAYATYPEGGADESAVQGDNRAARISRGGSWIGNSTTSRAAARVGMRQTSRRDFQGFRVAINPMR